jgi:hypothetical protein
MSVLQRLTHNLQNIPVEFRKLIQKKNAVIGQTHLARNRMCTAPKQTRI